MTRPVVSDAAERLYEGMRPYHEGLNEHLDEQTGWTLLLLCEAYATILARANDWLREDDLGSGRRRALDPDRCPSWALRPFLAPLAGVRIPVGAADDQVRELIKERPGRRAGSLPYIVAAVKAQLDGTQWVYTITNHGEIGRTTIATRADETPNPDAVVAVLNDPYVVPWWQQYDHEIVTGGTYEDLHATHATYDEVLDDFATYFDVLADPTHT